MSQRLVRISSNAVAPKWNDVEGDDEANAISNDGWVESQSVHRWRCRIIDSLVDGAQMPCSIMTMVNTVIYCNINQLAETKSV